MWCKEKYVFSPEVSLHCSSLYIALSFLSTLLSSFLVLSLILFHWFCLGHWQLWEHAVLGMHLSVVMASDSDSSHLPCSDSQSRSEQVGRHWRAGRENTMGWSQISLRAPCVNKQLWQAVHVRPDIDKMTEPEAEAHGKEWDRSGQWTAGECGRTAQRIRATSNCWHICQSSIMFKPVQFLTTSTLFWPITLALYTWQQCTWTNIFLTVKSTIGGPHHWCATATT